MQRIFQCPQCEVRYAPPAQSWGSMHACQRCQHRCFLGSFVELAVAHRNGSMAEQHSIRPSWTRSAIASLTVDTSLATAPAGSALHVSLASSAEFDRDDFLQVMREKLQEHRQLRRRRLWNRLPHWLRTLPVRQYAGLVSCLACYGFFLWGMVTLSRYQPSWWRALLQ